MLLEGHSRQRDLPGKGCMKSRVSAREREVSGTVTEGKLFDGSACFPEESGLHPTGSGSFTLYNHVC